MVNTSQTLLVRRSVAKLLFVTFAALLLGLFGAGSVILGFATGLEADGSLTIILVGTVIVTASGAAAFVFLRAIFGKDSFVLRFTTEGFTDNRFSDTEIPWQAVRRIEEIGATSAPMIAIDLDPDIENRLPLKKVPNAMRGINQAIGLAFTVSPAGLRINPKQLRKHWRHMLRIMDNCDCTALSKRGRNSAIMLISPATYTAQESSQLK